MKNIKSSLSLSPHPQVRWLVKTSEAESLIEYPIDSGWSWVAPSRFDNPGVCIRIQDDVIASSKTSWYAISTLLRTFRVRFKDLLRTSENRLITFEDTLKIFDHL